MLTLRTHASFSSDSRNCSISTVKKLPFTSLRNTCPKPGKSMRCGAASKRTPCSGSISGRCTV